MPFNIKTLFLIFISLTLYACSDSNNVPQKDIVVSASLGQITGADVTITSASGNTVGTGTLDGNGTATVSIPANTSSPMIVTVTGNANAKYFDEASGFEVELPSSRKVRAYARSSRTTVGVTPLTELAAQVAAQVGDNVTEADVDSINESVRSMFAPDVSDILTPPVLVSAANINSQSLGTDEASLYALRLAALATLGAGTDAPALTILSQLSDDLTDGIIDGNGAEGAIPNINYGDFSAAFSAAIQLASTTLANSDLLAQLDTITVATGANLLQQLIDGGLQLPSSVVDKIASSAGGGTGSVGGTGNYDLTISGNIVTQGISTPFNLTLPGIPAPDPTDTSAVTEIINSSLAGVTGVTSLTVTVVNNSSSQITFDVEFSAQQAGVNVTLALRYDYTLNGSSSNPDSGGGATDGGTGSGSGDGSTGGTTGGGTSGGNFCFAGDPTPATIPEFLSATVRTLTLTSAQEGSPFTQGETRSFTFSSSGLLFINDVQVASNPVICNGNEREAVWKDDTADLIYSVSDLTGTFNEVNLNRASDKAFLGQFTDASTDTAAPTGPPAKLTGLAATYETKVIESCSGSNCPNSTPVGELISVIIGTDGTVTFADLVLSTEVTNATYNEFNLMQTEPSITLSNPGANEGDEFSLEIYIQNDAVVGFQLKQSSSCGSGCSQSKNLYVEVTNLPAEVTALFDRFIAAVPTTLTVVADDTGYFGRSSSITSTPSSGSPLCQSFEISAAKDRSAVESSRYRPAFSFFSGSRGGDDYLRRVSRYKKDDATGDETLSFQSGQLVLRADGTIDYEEGFLDPSTGFVLEIKDRSTNDSAEVATACADFKQVSGTLSTTTAGNVRLELVDTATDTVIATKSISISTSAASNFAFVVKTGTAYNIRIGFASPSTLSCAFTDGSGTVAGADITNVVVSCQ